MKQQIIDRINRLRSLMLRDGIQAVIIPQTDPHQSEYIADHWQVRRYLSGFTGSAGTLVITPDEALLWTDSRYFIQSADQLKGTEIQLMKDGLPDTPSIECFLIDKLKRGDTVGIDGMLFSAEAAEKMQSNLGQHGLNLNSDYDVIDEVWLDRPSLPNDKVFVHDEKFAGESAKDKLQNILEEARKQMADAAFISPLDEIAWTLNIRCKDVKYNPVATAYLYVSQDDAVLLIDKEKLDDTTIDYLKSHGVNIAQYKDVKDFISSLPSDIKVLIEKNRTSVTLSHLLGDRAVMGTSPVAVAKGCKNAVQIEGFRNAMVKDGVALVRAFMEVEKKLSVGETITELDVDHILLKYRSDMELFFDESFGTIVGYGPHGAIVHYEPTVESNAVIEPHGLLLVDSGAQYLDGTTDITRTIALGVPTHEEKHDFTLVMKGHIALASMIFPAGTFGVQLDVEARKFLWQEGLTYLHGTGHGIGHFLNVHEGPQTIRMNPTPVPLMLGMITSNEPGLYRENVHGIRCENLVLCVHAMTTSCGEFLKFETLTLFPFDTTLLETEIMTDQEINWINDYHEEVYTRLAPMLDEKEREWLKNKTKPVKK